MKNPKYYLKSSESTGIHVDTLTKLKEFLKVWPDADIYTKVDKDLFLKFIENAES